MDEVMKQSTAAQPVTEPAEPETESAAEQAAEPKQLSLKAARSALKRMKSDMEKIIPIGSGKNRKDYGCEFSGGIFIYPGKDPKRKHSVF